MFPEIQDVSDSNVDSMYSTGKEALPAGYDTVMTPSGIAILGCGNILRSTLVAGSAYLYYILNEWEKNGWPQTDICP